MPRTSPAETPDYSVTGNVAVVSDYMFRGITQTWGHPAIQGGGDLTMKNGFAAGFWASSISERSYPGGAMELDLYGSYGANFNDDWSWRVGPLRLRLSERQSRSGQPRLASRSFNTLEANAALTWKWLTLKYSRSLTDYFAIDTEQGYDGDSKGTGYLQLDASIPLSDAWSLALHAGTHRHPGAPGHDQRLAGSELQRFRRDAEIPVRYALERERRRDLCHEQVVLRAHLELPRSDETQERRRQSRLRDAARHLLRVLSWASCIRQSLVMLVLMTLITGVIYPLVVTGMAQALFSHTANGSVIEATASRSAPS